MAVQTWQPNLFMIKAKEREMRDAGVEVGAMVKISWPNDPKYGDDDLSHTGPVAVFENGWLELEPTGRSPGHLRIGIMGIKSYEVVS